jgi:hypothetical protein
MNGKKRKSRHKSQIRYKNVFTESEDKWMIILNRLKCERPYSNKLERFYSNK